MKGTVYLVGAGPGAADLLTLRAAEVLKSAGIVFYDALVNPDILALAERADKIGVGKRSGRHSTAQHFINKRLVDAAASHKVVVRLKGGDPMLFGRAQEEIDALAFAGVPFQVVPGISAAQAASADLATSLTRRGVARSVAFVTPRTGEGEDPTQWLAAAMASDTTAIYMGVGQAASISADLIAAGKSPETPIVIVENASSPNFGWTAGTLRNLPAAAAAARSQGGPALILVGEVYRKVIHTENLQHERISA